MFRAGCQARPGRRWRRWTLGAVNYCSPPATCNCNWNSNCNRTVQLLGYSCLYHSRYSVRSIVFQALQSSPIFGSPCPLQPRGTYDARWITSRKTSLIAECGAALTSPGHSVHTCTLDIQCQCYACIHSWQKLQDQVGIRCFLAVGYHS